MIPFMNVYLTLKVINFYGTINVINAKFNSAFEKLLFDSLKYIEAEDVEKFVKSQPDLLMTRSYEIIQDAYLLQYERLINQ